MRLLKIETKVDEIDCDYWKQCFKFMRTKMSSKHLVESNHICFCDSCHIKRGDRNTYTRGTPSKVYELPRGFAAFAVNVKTNPEFSKREILTNWHVSFHGTTLDSYNSIAAGGMKLLKPGEVARSGKTI